MRLRRGSGGKIDFQVGNNPIPNAKNKIEWEQKSADGELYYFAEIKDLTFTLHFRMNGNGEKWWQINMNTIDLGVKPLRMTEAQLVVQKIVDGEIG